MADRLNGRPGPSAAVIQRSAEAPDSWEDLADDHATPQPAIAAAPVAAAAPERNVRQELNALLVRKAVKTAFLGRAGADPGKDLDAIRAATRGNHEAIAAGVGVMANGGTLAAAQAAAQTFETVIGWTLASITVADVIAQVNASTLVANLARTWASDAHTGRAYSFTLDIGGVTHTLQIEWHAHWTHVDRPANAHFKSGMSGLRGGHHSAADCNAMKAILSSKGWGPA
jgi:hypothetical protein